MEKAPDAFRTISEVAVDLDVPQHVLVTYKAGVIRCFVDGKNVTSALTKAADFNVWKEGPIVFGNSPGTGQDWPGTLEAVAMYSRAIEINEVAANAALAKRETRVVGRTPIPRLVVEARLVEFTENTTPDAIRPYRRALLEDNYEVIRVVEGVCADKAIAVGRWGILDAQTVPLKREKGRVETLVLEPMSEHPNFESERSLNETSDFTLPVYLNMRQQLQGW